MVTNKRKMANEGLIGGGILPSKRQTKENKSDKIYDQQATKPIRIDQHLWHKQSSIALIAYGNSLPGSASTARWRGHIST